MLKVATKIGPSVIEGLGLFADQPIAPGTRVWVFEPDVDRCMPTSVLHGAGAQQRAFLETYAWREGDMLFLCCDDMRFLNHSPSPNLVAIRDGSAPLGVALVAARDIRAGEELTGDYSAYDQDFSSYARCW